MATRPAQEAEVDLTGDTRGPAAAYKYILFEVIDSIVLQRPHHVADEAFRMHVGHARTAIARGDHVADRVHQMGVT